MESISQEATSSRIDNTPQATSGRAINPAIEYLKKHKTPDQDPVIVTEHYTTKVLKQLTALDLTTNPTATPEENDPFVALKASLEESSGKYGSEEDIFENPEFPRKVIDFYRNHQREKKKSAIISPGEKYATKPIKYPIPTFLQPKEVMLTSKAMKKSHDQLEGKKALSERPSQLSGKGKHAVLEKKPMEEPFPEEDEALDMNMASTSQEQQSYQQEEEGRKARIDRYLDSAKYEIADHPILRNSNGSTADFPEFALRPTSPPNQYLPRQSDLDDMPQILYQEDDQIIANEECDILQQRDAAPDETHRSLTPDGFNGQATSPLPPLDLLSGHHKAEDTNDQVDTPQSPASKVQAGFHSKLGWSDSTETIYREYLNPEAFQEGSQDLVHQMEHQHQAVNIDHHAENYAHNEGLEMNDQPGSIRVPHFDHNIYLNPPTIDPSIFSNTHSNRVPHSEDIRHSGVNNVLANDLGSGMFGVTENGQAANTEGNLLNEPQTTVPVSWNDPTNITYPSNASRPTQPNLVSSGPSMKPRWATWQDDGPEPRISHTIPASSHQLSAQTSRSFAPMPNSELQTHTASDQAPATQTSEVHVPPRTRTAKRSPQPLSSQDTKRPRQSAIPIRKSLSLHEIVTARQSAPADSSTPASSEQRKGVGKKEKSAVQAASSKRPDLFSLDGYLGLEQRKDLIKTSDDEPNSNMDLPYMESEDDWTSDISIKNPKWYLKACNYDGTPRQERLPILVALPVFQKIPFIRSLRAEGFELVERGKKMHCCDMVISPFTALMLQDLSRISYNKDNLIQNLKIASTHFDRVIVVFETISFSAAEKTKDANENPDPLSTEVKQALTSLRRLIPLALNSTGKPTGQVELVFAYNGAGEVSKALMGLIEDEGKKMLKKDERAYSEVYEDRHWLSVEPQGEQLEQLSNPFGLNIFCAWYALIKVGDISHLVTEMNDKEREKAFKHIFGENVMEIFNEEIKEKGWLVGGKGQAEGKGKGKATGSLLG